MHLYTSRSNTSVARGIMVGAALFSLLCWSSSSVRAQEEEESTDKLEVVLSLGALIPGGGIADYGDSLGAKTGSASGVQIGFFVTPEITLGVDLAYGRLGVDNPNWDNLRHEYYNAMLYGKYFFFGEGKLAPFVKVMGGVHTPKFTTVVFDNRISQYRLLQRSFDPAPAIGASAGLLFLTSDNGGLFLEAGYQMSFSKKVSDTFQGAKTIFNKDASLLTLKAGFNLFFGS